MPSLPAPATRALTPFPLSSILFLDFDGVLNSHVYLATNPRAARHWKEQKLVLDPERMRHLNDLVGRGNCAVVVSSDWRKRYELVTLRQHLKKAGFAFSERMIAVTPDFGEKPRGLEIEHWMSKMCPGGRKPFVILDDRLDMEPNMGHHVHIDHITGMRQKHVYQAIKILEK